VRSMLKAAKAIAVAAWLATHTTPPWGTPAHSKY
jgi:hypothetical protein